MRDSLLPLIGLAIFSWLLIIGGIWAFNKPAHQRCNKQQLTSIGHAGGTVFPDTCDNLTNYLSAFPPRTPVTEMAPYEPS